MTDTYIALDLETTGLNPTKDRILEIGAVKVKGGQIQGTYETLVNPGVRISGRIEELTGITNEMAAQGLEAAEAVREFAAFSRSLPLIGHNILFDYSFLKQAAVNHGIPFEKECLDTLKFESGI